jgi:hypothetical protein
MDEAESTMLGSGVMATAPMAVKWWLQIASVSSSAPMSLARSEDLRSATNREAAPIRAPSRIEAATNARSHATVPATSKAAMPV